MLEKYSGLNDFRRKSVSELMELKQAGLDTAYSGLESGDDVVLKRIKKHLTPSQAIEGALMAKEAGIEVLQLFIFGLAVQPGSELEREVNEAIAKNPGAQENVIQTFAW